jgi:hypothetical protein
LARSGTNIIGVATTAVGDHKVQITVADTTPNYLSSKINSGGTADITTTVTSPAANEGLRLNVRAITETSGPTQLVIGSIPDGDLLARSGSTVIGQPVVATWSASLVRYFLLDYDGGNDANIGYIDAAAGSTLVPAGLAIKTFEQLFLIIAKLGAALPAVILVKNRAAGATYLQKDGITASDVDLSGLVGYASLDIRGSTDLTNSATDRVVAGAIQGDVGPGGGGVWTCAGGATTTVFSISAGALAAEPADIGMRVRFTGNVTAGLTNVTAYISANTNTQITVGAAITAPAAGDTFTIEIPGVRVNTLCLASSPGARGITARAMRLTAVGIAAVRDSANSFVVGGSGDTQVSFCETIGTANVTHAVIEAMQSLTVQKTYTDETNTARVVGFGLRVRGDFLISDVFMLTCTEFAAISTTATAAATRVQRVLSGQFGTLGGYIGRSTTYVQCGFAPSHPNNQVLLIGGGRNAAAIAMRCIGAQIFNACGVALAGIDVTGAGATGAITISNPTNVFSVNFDRISGSTGNTGVGLDLLGASRTQLFIGSGVVCTVTGTAGDVKLPSSVIMSYTALATGVGFRDTNFNQVVGSAVPKCGDVAQVFTNGDGTAHLLGELVRQSAAGTVVRAQADTEAHATGALFVAVTDPATGSVGYYVPLAGNMRLAAFDAAPTSLAIAYVSVTTAGRATTTIPPVSGTNQKRRLGFVVTVTGTNGITTGNTENIPVLADGLL